jgi:hypothetical protein
MNLPVSDAASRCLFKDEATHMPVGASWCRASQESPLLTLAFVPEVPESCSANVINPVA